METPCASETRAFCAREADLVALLASASVPNEQALRQRRQRVRDCLVDHADELSANCVAALVGNVATQHSELPERDDANEAETEPEQPALRESEPAAEQDALETPAPKPTMKPVVQVFQETSAPVVQQQAPQYVQTTADGDAGIEVRIFLINHPGHAAAAPAPQYIRIGGDSNQHIDGDVPSAADASSSGMTISPWLWVAILPFMCIGIYVSAVQTLAFVRRRRDVIYRVGNTQYMPIPTSLNPSK